MYLHVTPLLTCLTCQEDVLGLVSWIMISQARITAALWLLNSYFSSMMASVSIIIFCQTRARNSPHGQRKFEHHAGILADCLPSFWRFKYLGGHIIFPVYCIRLNILLCWKRQGVGLWWKKKWIHTKVEERRRLMNELMIIKWAEDQNYAV